MNRDHSVIFEIAPKYCISDSFIDCEGYSISSKGFLPTVVDTMVIWIKFTHSSPVYFTDSSNVDVRACHLLFDHFQFALIHGPNISSPYAVSLFTASGFTSITSHIHSWVLCLLWLHLFFLELFLHWSPVAYWIPTNLGGFIVHYHVFLPFHTVHGVLKARTLTWFAITFSSGPHFVRTLHHDPSILGGPTRHGS